MIESEEVIFMRHTTMPPRLQRTPLGDVSLTSRWMRDHYQLRAYGPIGAIRWMFPLHAEFELFGEQARHTFEPSPKPVTVDRDLRRICGSWQEAWDHRCDDEQDRPKALLGTPPSENRSIVTVGNLIDGYQRAKAASIRPASYEKTRHQLAPWRRALGPDTALSSVTEQLLLETRAAFLATRQPSTVNCMMAVWKSAWMWAHDLGQVSFLPFKKISKLKEPKNHRSKGWWRPDEVELALRCAREDKLQPTAVLLVAMGCMLGMRYEEIIMQRWEDLDLDGVAKDGCTPNPVCHVVLHDGWQPKNGEARTIPIPERLAVTLTEYRQPTGYLLTAEVLKSPRVKLRKDNGKRVYRYDPAKVWKRIIKRVVGAGGKRITPHGMRHSFASNLLIAGVSDMKVATWLGHADTSLLHERYGHLLSYDANINAVRFGP